VGHSTTAAAPSHTGELSSRFTGSAIIFAAPKSSAVTGWGKQRKRIAHGVLVRVDGKRREVRVAHAIFVHVASHEQSIERYERQSVLRLEIGVGGHGQGSRHLIAWAIRHFFHACHHHEIRQLARHRNVAQPKRRRARTAGRFDLDGFDPAQANPVADECAQVLLPIERARTHVADVERIDAFHLGVLDGVLNRLSRQSP